MVVAGRGFIFQMSRFLLAGRSWVYIYGQLRAVGAVRKTGWDTENMMRFLRWIVWVRDDWKPFADLLCRIRCHLTRINLKNRIGVDYRDFWALEDLQSLFDYLSAVAVLGTLYRASRWNLLHNTLWWFCYLDVRYFNIWKLSNDTITPMVSIIYGLCCLHLSLGGIRATQDTKMSRH